MRLPKPMTKPSWNRQSGHDNATASHVTPLSRLFSVSARRLDRQVPVVVPHVRQQARVGPQPLQPAAALVLDPGVVGSAPINPAGLAADVVDRIVGIPEIVPQQCSTALLLEQRQGPF